VESQEPALAGGSVDALETRAERADFAPVERGREETLPALGCERRFLKELDLEQRPWEAPNWRDS